MEEAEGKELGEGFGRCGMGYKERFIRHVDGGKDRVRMCEGLVSKFRLGKEMDTIDLSSICSWSPLICRASMCLRVWAVEQYCRLTSRGLLRG